VLGGLIGEVVLRDVRRSGFDQLQRLSQGFYARSNTGDLLSRITNDMDGLRSALSQTAPILLFQTLSLVAAAVFLLLLNWKLGLLMLILSVPTFIGIYSRASDQVRQASRAFQEEVGAMTSFVQENLAGQMVVKSFGLERRSIESFEQFLGRLFDKGMRLIRVGAWLSGSSNMVFLASRVVVLAVGAYLVMNEQMTVGELVAFAGMVIQVLQPVVMISGLYQQLQSATGSFERVDELMREEPEVSEYASASELPSLQNEIRLEHLSFRYGNGGGGLRDVSITIPAGQRVAIVGPSGAGKSTLVGLLLRLYDPQEGHIRIDGVDVRDGTLESLRRQVALVPQDTFLFDTSIRENIALARQAATNEQIMDAARAAALHDVIENTERGYDTLVGERGVRLSGGQRQRLAIARALLRDPRILILDEATSALDAGTEASILQALRSAADGRTVIAITHRLNLAAESDVVFVFDRGRLVEQGTHDELCRQQGLYWRLWQEQQAGLSEDLPELEPGRLVEIPLFASLTAAELRAVARRLSVEPYTAGTTVVEEGDVADRLYIVGDGTVEVSVKDRQGSSRRIKQLGPRSYFGEVALLEPEPTHRIATVRAVTDVTLYSLHNEDFRDLLTAHPTLAQAVSRLARMRVQQTSQFST
jgi:ABC-type multidrug transport system fused ATPase/permease subunit